MKFSLLRHLMNDVTHLFEDLQYGMIFQKILN